MPALPRAASTMSRRADMLATARPRPVRAAMAAEREFSDGEVVPGTRYRVVGLIGSGGMGSVYEVEHVELGKRFVLKALLRGLANRDDLVRRLRNEWKALGRLEHVNIVGVTDAGVTTTGVPYFVMERLVGETLAARIRRERRLRVSDSLSIAADVLEGLSAAHSLGIVHRDVKPPNIFLVSGRPAKLLDFGIAKLLDPKASQITGRGIAIGTPRYMSPEQTAGGTVDARSDLYSTGIILFEMIAGAGPFDDARDGNELFLSQLTREPPLLSKFVPVPAELQSTLSRLLAKKAAERPGDAAAVARTFRALAGSLRNEPAAFAPLDDRTLPGGPFDTLEAAATIPSDANHSKALNDAASNPRESARGESARGGASRASWAFRGKSGGARAGGAADDDAVEATLRLGTLELEADSADGVPTHTAAPRPLLIIETPPPAEPLPSSVLRIAQPRSHARTFAVVAALGACGIAMGVVAARRNPPSAAPATSVTDPAARLPPAAPAARETPTASANSVRAAEPVAPLPTDLATGPAEPQPAPAAAPAPPAAAAASRGGLARGRAPAAVASSRAPSAPAPRSSALAAASPAAPPPTPSAKSAKKPAIPETAKPAASAATAAASGARPPPPPLSMPGSGL